MTELVLYSPPVSTYARICAVVAEEAGVAWRIQPMDAKTVRARGLHPFARTPAAHIDGELIYETRAVAAYLDAAHNDGALTPTDPLALARMQQWISVADNYLFAVSDPGLVLPRLVAPLMGRQADEAFVARALPVIDWQLGLLSERLELAGHVAGPELSLADLHLWPMIHAIGLTNEGAAMIGAKLPLARWKDALAQRPSAIATRWPGEPN